MRSTSASFNYTRRKRIERDQVSIRAQTSDGRGVLSIERLNIEELQLPGHGEIIMEVRTARRRIVRISAGNVSEFVPSVQLDLGEPGVDGLRITLKVVDYSGGRRGAILALGQGLRPDFGGETAALLPLSVRDLGDRVWNLNFDGELGPELEISEKVEDHYSLYQDPLFRALVLPAVVKEIATWVVRHLDEDPDSVLGECVQLWSRFFRERGNEPSGVNSDEEEEVQAWADGVSDSFASSITAIGSFVGKYAQGES